MFLIRKSLKSKARFLISTSKYFSFKKNKFFYINLKNNSGRNNLGYITTRHRRKLKKNVFFSINYTRNYIFKRVVTTEICFWKKKKPFLLLVKNRYNSISYFIAPHGIFLNEMLRTVFLTLKLYYTKKLGNLISLKLLRVGNCIFNLLTLEFKFFKIAIASGTFFKILYRSHCKNFFILRLPSGKKKKFLINSFGVLGKNSNKFFKKHVVGLAGISFHHGKRPSVRGVAMNPVDHPHGGRAKTNKPEKSPWGWIAKHSK